MELIYLDVVAHRAIKPQFPVALVHFKSPALATGDRQVLALCYLHLKLAFKRGRK